MNPLIGVFRIAELRKLRIPSRDRNDPIVRSAAAMTACPFISIIQGRKRTAQPVRGRPKQVLRFFSSDCSTGSEGWVPDGERTKSSTRPLSWQHRTRKLPRLQPNVHEKGALLQRTFFPPTGNTRFGRLRMRNQKRCWETHRLLVADRFWFCHSPALIQKRRSVAAFGTPKAVQGWSLALSTSQVHG